MNFSRPANYSYNSFAQPSVAYRTSPSVVYSSPSRVYQRPATIVQQTRPVHVVQRPVAVVRPVTVVQRPVVITRPAPEPKPQIKERVMATRFQAVENPNGGEPTEYEPIETIFYKPETKTTYQSNNSNTIVDRPSNMFGNNNQQPAAQQPVQPVQQPVQPAPVQPAPVQPAPVQVNAAPNFGYQQPQQYNNQYGY